MDSKTVSRPAEQKPVSQARSTVLRVFGEIPFHTEGATVALAFGPDSCLWSVEEAGVLRQWDPAHGSPLASCTEDRVIRIRRADSGQLLGTLAGHTDRIPALAWHPQGDRLIAAGWDTTARVWDTQTFQPIILLNAHAGQVTALALSR